MRANFSGKTILLTNIERLRTELIRSGLEKGLTHPNTVELSQKLDKLLNEYKEMMTIAEQSFTT